MIAKGFKQNFIFVWEEDNFDVTDPDVINPITGECSFQIEMHENDRMKGYQSDKDYVKDYGFLKQFSLVKPLSYRITIVTNSECDAQHDMNKLESYGTLICKDYQKEEKDSYEGPITVSIGDHKYDIVIGIRDSSDLFNVLIKNAYGEGTITKIITDITYEVMYNKDMISMLSPAIITPYDRLIKMVMKDYRSLNISAIIRNDKELYMRDFTSFEVNLNGFIEHFLTTKKAKKYFNEDDKIADAYGRRLLGDRSRVSEGYYSTSPDNISIGYSSNNSFISTGNGIDIVDMFYHPKDYYNGDTVVVASVTTNNNSYKFMMYFKCSEITNDVIMDYYITFDQNDYSNYQLRNTEFSALLDLENYFIFSITIQKEDWEEPEYYGPDGDDKKDTSSTIPVSGDN